MAEKLKTIISRYENKQADIFENLKNQKYSKRILIYDNQSKIVTSILRSFKIELKVGRGDADALIAKLAKGKGAPILSKDSDFYIFNLTGYSCYVDFQDFPRLKQLTQSGKILVRSFNQEKFLKFHQLKSIQDLLCAACVMGNDFTDSYQGQKWSFEQFVLKYKSGKGFNINKNNSKIQSVYKFYNLESPFSDQAIDLVQSKDTFVNKPTLNNLLKNYSEGFTQTEVIGLAIDGLIIEKPQICSKQASCWMKFRTIRELIYSFLKLEEVTEFARIDKSHKWRRYSVVPKKTRTSNLDIFELELGDIIRCFTNQQIHMTCNTGLAFLFAYFQLVSKNKLRGVIVQLFSAVYAILKVAGSEYLSNREIILQNDITIFEDQTMLSAFSEFTTLYKQFSMLLSISKIDGKNGLEAEFLFEVRQSYKLILDLLISKPYLSFCQSFQMKEIIDKTA